MDEVAKDQSNHDAEKFTQQRRDDGEQHHRTCKSAINAAYDAHLSVGRRNLQCQRHAVMIERFIERYQSTMYT